MAASLTLAAFSTASAVTLPPSPSATAAGARATAPAAANPMFCGSVIQSAKPLLDISTLPFVSWRTTKPCYRDMEDTH